MTEIIKPKGRTALSHSRLSDFNQCPRKFYLKYFEKAPNFQIDQANKSVHLVRGDNVHKALEKYVIQRKDGKTQEEIGITSLSEVEGTKPLIEKYIAIFGIDNVHPEAQVSIDDAWRKVTWFDKASYYRAIIDFTGFAEDTALAVDWKTGKFREYTPADGYGQLELTSAIGLSIFDVEQFKTSYVYVDHKQIVSKSYTQNDRDRLVSHFIAEHDKVNAEVNYDPKPNEFCTWCEATKAQCPKSRKL